MARDKGLYRRKDSPYWWINTVLPNGQRVQKSTRLVEQRDAEEFLTNLKADAYKALRYGTSANHKWQEAVVRYLRENADKRTLNTDRIYLRQLDPYLSGKTLESINMDALWPFIFTRKEDDGVTNATINRPLEVVRRILHMARDEWCWIQRFPRIRMLKEPKRRIRFLTRTEADRLLEELPAHLRPVMQLALATGCRRGEILQMEWRRVDFNRRVAWLDIGTTKNTEGRGLPLNRDAILALRSVQGQGRRWCFAYEGNTMKQIGSAWKRALARAGIEDFRFHDRRHTWASWHVMSGTSLQELMELGSWKSYEMVLRYAHLAPEQLAGAASRIERRIEPVVGNATISLR
jgi:integrase